jgi:hypothetical protein
MPVGISKPYTFKWRSGTVGFLQLYREVPSTLRRNKSSVDMTIILQQAITINVISVVAPIKNRYDSSLKYWR